MGVEFVVGTDTLLELISSGHGAIRVPLAQNFDYTPAFDERRIFEFDRADAIAIVTNFNGVDISFNYFDTDSALVDSVVNDLDPGAAAILDDPANYKDFHALLNVRNSDNKIFQSVLCKFVRLRGSASSEPVREEATITRDGAATNAFRLKGVAIEYTRALKTGSSAFTQGGSNSRSDKTTALVSGNQEFDTDNVPVAIEAADPDLNGKKIVFIMKNGEEYTDIVTVSGSTVSIPDANFDTDDVFEVFTTYIDA